jgi:hypothetical protein
MTNGNTGTLQLPNNLISSEKGNDGSTPLVVFPFQELALAGCIYIYRHVWDDGTS